MAGARLSILPDLPASEAVWREATAHCGASAFQTYEWLSAWFDTIGTAERARAYIVHVAARDDTTLLLIPLAIHARAYGLSLEFLGGDLTDYNLPLVNPAHAIGPTDIQRLWAEILARLPRVDLVRLTRMPLSLDHVQNPLAALAGAAQETKAYGAHLPADFEAFAAARSEVFFRKNKQYRRRLEKEGQVRIAFPEEGPERLAIIRFLIDQKSRWQQAAGVANTFARADTRAFYERMTQTTLREGSVSTAGLWVGDDLVAGLWGVIFRGRYAFLITSYRTDWSKLSVGRLLIESVIQMCIGRGDLKIFDLTVGEEGYKASWADHTLPLYRYQAARSLRGHAVMAFWHLRARVKDWPGLRRSVRAVTALAHRLRNRS
ncbi:GNAT family N-acetyltransferase [Methylobacterium soli]|uniref:GNAT family N-acetyltransferase n=1 Tax=Methylobacterium soli TaxID=553447 RepID=A0A6L3SXC6_9HYPH|nr:GNAT family N-acetyltransferase [Methylobacterium soli]KAB1078568.1 GNAT family N-acetyltransferase [Methylobacterium soli]GJE42536.1 hypothetical protein AEGHOMDF_1708 [Methylobacterium soli]